MFCSNCGAKVEGDYKFCIACGAALPKRDDSAKAMVDKTDADEQAAETANETFSKNETAAEHFSDENKEIQTSANFDEPLKSVGYSSQVSDNLQKQQQAQSDGASCSTSHGYDVPSSIPNNTNSTSISDKTSLIGALSSWFKGLNKPKKIAVIAAAILLFFLIIGHFGKSGSSSEPEQIMVHELKNQLYLDIAYEYDLHSDSSDTYDIEIYLDGAKIGRIVHGRYFTSLQEVTDGRHTVKFYKNGDHSISAKEVISIKTDSTFRCALKSYTDEITTSDVEMLRSIIGNAIAVENVINMNLYEARQLLEDKDFVNVTHSSEDGKIILNELNWIVVSQSVDAGTEIDKNDEIILICRKADSYMGEMFDGLSAIDAQKKADEKGYSLSFLNGANKDEMTEKMMKMTEKEKELWVVSESSVVSSAANHVRLYIVYTGEVEAPDVKGMILSEAVFELKLSDFSNIKSTSNNGKTILDDDNWVVISQSVESGEKARADAQIVLTCKKLETSAQSNR